MQPPGGSAAQRLAQAALEVSVRAVSEAFASLEESLGKLQLLLDEHAVRSRFTKCV